MKNKLQQIIKIKIFEEIKCYKKKKKNIIIKDLLKLY